MPGIADSFEKFTKKKGAAKAMPPAKGAKGKKPMPAKKPLGSAKKMPMPMGGALGSYMR